MHPRIRELLDHLDVQRGYLRAAVDSVPPARREVAPAPGRWSVADVLEHLALLERRLTGLFSKRIAEARAAGLGAETQTDSVLASSDMVRLVDRTRRLTAPETVHPTAGLTAAAAWSALEESRVGLRAMIDGADGFALGEITHDHAAFGTLNLYQWIAFIGGHEARHADQIREIGQELDQG
jgi:hypothetical protein